MSTIDQDGECPGCGSTLKSRQEHADRAKARFPDEEYTPYLTVCRYCDNVKCSMCDMGDDTDCISCNGEDE